MRPSIDHIGTFMCESSEFNGPHCRVQCDRCKPRKRMTHFEYVHAQIEATREAIVADRDFSWLPKENISNWIKHLAQSI